MRVRFSHLAWIAMGVATLYVTYQVKYHAQEIEDEIAATQREIAGERDSIHVLEAEWSYLNRPDRLARLAAEYKGLQRVAATQIVSVDTLPMAPERAPAPREASAPASPSAPSGAVLPAEWSATGGEPKQ